jgi:hypothetical protein
MYSLCVRARARAWNACAQVCVDVNVAKLPYWPLVCTVCSCDIDLVWTLEGETCIFYE